MTMLAVTVTDQGAILSQDSLMYEPSADCLKHAEKFAHIGDFSESIESMYVGGGDPSVVEVIGQCCKVFPLPRFRMAIAVTGDYRFSAHWAHDLATVQPCDIVELDRLAPDYLCRLRDQLPVRGAVMIVHAGYSTSRQTGAAFSYSSNEDFRSVEVKLGDTLSAAPDPDDPCYADIYALNKKFKEGGYGRQDIEAYHRALMEQQLRAFYSGKLAPGIAVGGDLDHVIVDRERIEITTARQTERAHNGHD